MRYYRQAGWMQGRINFYLLLYLNFIEDCSSQSDAIWVSKLLNPKKTCYFPTDNEESKFSSWQARTAFLNAILLSVIIVNR